MCRTSPRSWELTHFGIYPWYPYLSKGFIVSHLSCPNFGRSWDLAFQYASQRGFACLGFLGPRCRTPSSQTYFSTLSSSCSDILKFFFFSFAVFLKIVWWRDLSSLSTIPVHWMCWSHVGSSLSIRLSPKIVHVYSNIVGTAPRAVYDHGCLSPKIVHVCSDTVGTAPRAGKDHGWLSPKIVHMWSDTVGTAPGAGRELLGDCPLK